ncbi:MAG TPA: radical SAM family heme chaperone HemW [Pseudomonadales bacterium]|nr:radical SAM family heme chaperone HemW [Pseudomonadales bacterium]
MMQTPPLSLYVHFPWCVRKCPYCDFNSHPAKGELPEAAYLDQLLRDLDRDLNQVPHRTIETIFIGGGTPSLISGRTIAALLGGIRDRALVADDAEITLEANPGTVDEANFAAYRAAGVDRLSIGAQSFDASHLAALGRIHDPDDIEHAVATAKAAGFERFNLDLMHGLPGQTADQAVRDLKRALVLGASHVSWYQLTIEPRTEFALHPPRLPDEDALATIEAAGLATLEAAGLRRYEVSAFAREDQAARHNVNYWTFGDYLGIGAGAHGKLTFAERSAIIRTSKPLAPARYLGAAPDDLRSEAAITADARPGEFLLNALRLVDGVEPQLFEQRTDCALSTIHDTWKRLHARGLVQRDRLAVTDLGLRYLDTVVGEFI